MDKQAAVNEIAVLVSNAYTAIEAAQRLATEHKVEFSFSVSYGMGGTYYPEGSEYVPDHVDGYSGAKFGWAASSQSC